MLCSKPKGLIGSLDSDWLCFYSAEWCQMFPEWCQMFPERCQMFPKWCQMFPEWWMFRSVTGKHVYSVSQQHSAGLLLSKPLHSNNPRKRKPFYSPIRIESSESRVHLCQFFWLAFWHTKRSVWDISVSVRIIIRVYSEIYWTHK